MIGSGCILERKSVELTNSVGCRIIFGGMALQVRSKAKSSL